MRIPKTSNYILDSQELSDEQKPLTALPQAVSNGVEITGRLKRTWSPARRKAYEDKKLLKESFIEISSNFLKGTSLTAKEKAALKAQKKEERAAKRAARQEELELRRQDAAARKAARAAKKDETKKAKTQVAIESANLIQWPQTQAEVEFFQNAPLDAVSTLSREEIEEYILPQEEEQTRFYFCPIFYLQYYAPAFLRASFQCGRYAKFSAAHGMRLTQLKQIKARLQMQLLKNRSSLLHVRLSSTNRTSSRPQFCQHKLQKYKTLVKASRNASITQMLFKKRSVNTSVQKKFKYTLSDHYSNYINWRLWLRYQWRCLEFDDFIFDSNSAAVEDYLQEEETIFWTMWDLPEEHLEELELGWPTLAAIQADWAIFAALDESFFSRLAGIDEISDNITDFPDFDEEESFPFPIEEELLEYKFLFDSLNPLLNQHASAWDVSFNFTILSIIPNSIGVSISPEVRDNLYEMRHALNAVAHDIYDEEFEVALILDFFFDPDDYYLNDYDYDTRPWNFSLKQNLTEFFIPNAYFLNSFSLLDPTFRFKVSKPIRSLKFLLVKLKACVYLAPYFFYSTFEDFSECSDAFEVEELDWLEIVEDENDLMEFQYDELKENFLSFVYATTYHSDTLITYNQIWEPFHFPIRRIHEDAYFFIQMLGAASRAYQLVDSDVVEDAAFFYEDDEVAVNSEFIEAEADFNYDENSITARDTELALYKDLWKARRVWARTACSAITKVEKKFKLKVRENYENDRDLKNNSAITFAYDIIEALEVNI